MMESRLNRGQGFSFIELIISVAILALLATAAVPMVELTMQRAREQELRYALREIRQAIDAYKKAVEENRIDMNEDESGYPRTLDVLATGVPDATDPNNKKMIYFLRNIPRDPMYIGGWDVPPSATWGKRSYLSPPEAPQEGPDVFDVYSLNTRKGLNGIPYNAW